MPGPDLLARLDAAIAELQAIRAELVLELPSNPGTTPVLEGVCDDSDVLLDTTSAAARFSLARDTVAKACREIPGVGVWKGGRWQVRVGAMRQHLDRKNNQ
jgi:hypothetical protein